MATIPIIPRKRSKIAQACRSSGTRNDVWKGPSSKKYSRLTMTVLVTGSFDHPRLRLRRPERAAQTEQQDHGGDELPHAVRPFRSPGRLPTRILRNTASTRLTSRGH